MTQAQPILDTDFYGNPRSPVAQDTRPEIPSIAQQEALWRKLLESAGVSAPNIEFREGKRDGFPLAAVLVYYAGSATNTLRLYQELFRRMYGERHMIFAPRLGRASYGDGRAAPPDNFTGFRVEVIDLHAIRGLKPYTAPKRNWKPGELAEARRSGAGFAVLAAVLQCPTIVQRMGEEGHPALVITDIVVGDGCHASCLNVHQEWDAQGRLSGAPFFGTSWLDEPVGNEAIPETIRAFEL